MTNIYRNTQRWEDVELDVIHSGEFELDGYLLGENNDMVDWKRYHSDFPATWRLFFDVAIDRLASSDNPVPNDERLAFIDVATNDDEIVAEYDYDPFYMTSDWLINVLPFL